MSVTLTWNPAADTSIAISNTTGANHYGVEADANDASYVWQATPSAYYSNYYATDNAANLVPSGATSISIKVYARGQSTNDAYAAYQTVGIKSGATTSQHGGSSLLTTAHTDDYTWTLDPATGLAWTVAGINAVLIGRALNSHLKSTARGLKCYAEVTYTPAPASSFVSRIWFH